MHVRVEEIEAGATHELRRRVLRAGDPASVVEFDGDRDPGAFHLGAFDDTAGLVGVVTFLPNRWDERPGDAAFQLRGMAVDPAEQGAGIGRALLAAGLDRARAEGAQVVWAKGRDAVLGFYERLGWKVVGDGFVYGPMNLPHHVVVTELA
jgi:predicted N-acetyltransferase YhbS